MPVPVFVIEPEVFEDETTPENVVFVLLIAKMRLPPPRAYAFQRKVGVSCLSDHAGCRRIAYTVRVNNREFRQRLAELLARQRKEAEAQAKKPPSSEKPKKASKTRSA